MEGLKFYFRFYLILFGLLFLNGICEAKNVPGFIITENSDTLIGQVRIYNRNPNLRGFNFSGIDIEPFYSIVRFKAFNDKHFRNYEAGDIKGFCFRYKSGDYIFRQFKLEKNSLFSVDHNRICFLNLIYKGKLSLYQDVVRFPITKNFDNFMQYSEIYYDYYLYDEDKGLRKVELTKGIINVRDILANYNVDEDFLKEIPENAKLKNIKLILEEYDYWLIRHSSEKSGN